MDRVLQEYSALYALPDTLSVLITANAVHPATVSFVLQVLAHYVLPHTTYSIQLVMLVKWRTAAPALVSTRVRNVYKTSTFLL